MSDYRLGSYGEPVAGIQRRLAELGLYSGAIDRRFGGGTEAAVKKFQSGNRLAIDGRVGALTWQKLFPGEGMQENPLLSEPLDMRCLALAGSFETGSLFPDCFSGLSGDFDGQGISFGIAQWNFGQGSLQPLLREALTVYPGVMATIFHEHVATLQAVIDSQGGEDDLAFARSIQHPVSHVVGEPWRGMFRALGRAPEFQRTQLKFAKVLLIKARQWMNDYRLHSQRALALFFDIAVQNGGIAATTAARIHAEFRNLPGGTSSEEDELKRMRIVAHCRADAAKKEWADDVRARKLCIAEGRGRVHGIDYDLAAQFGLGLAPA